jgi:dolichyl-phosphate beta-glucosyltransferase
MLSIIIPAYNEEQVIKTSLTKIFDFVESNKIESEVIVVDDGSHDNTINIVEDFRRNDLRILRNNHNRGKGYSVKRGMLNANGDLMLFSDADLSTPIEELTQFLGNIEGYDVLIASRSLKDSNVKIKQPTLRNMLGNLFPFFVKHLLLKGITDTQCGFKMFKKECAKDIFMKQRINGWSFDAEILFIAKKHGCKIKQLPVVWNNDTRSKINPMTDPPKMLFELLKIRFYNIMGYYKKKQGL